MEYLNIELAKNKEHTKASVFDIEIQNIIILRLSSCSKVI